MDFVETMERMALQFDAAAKASGEPLARFKNEIDFAKAFKDIHPAKANDWEKLITQACEGVLKGLAGGGAVDAGKLVEKAEKTLEPIAKEAKKHTIHCLGHAHIDMNWMWDWPETVNVTHDTFLTVNTLMDEFPGFIFGQSQASTYMAMEEHCPEIFEMIGKRIKEGAWEVTASMWVEGDKNLASGESLCRHMLYTRKYMEEKFGFEPAKVKIDWSPDTFGHAHTVPSILVRGGVSRYYHMRTGPGPWLYKWRSPDGSEITVFNEKDEAGYNGELCERMSMNMVEFCKENGLKDYLFVYGVGDHGGGPTRKDLRRMQDFQSWPVFPTVRFGSSDEFFTAVEKAGSDLPVIDKDLNFIFEGCYTSQSTIKKANRVSEIILPEAETVALVGAVADKMDYPHSALEKAWQRTLFNHFHDILPGSGVRGTRHYTNGLFQEIQATALSIRTRALRKLASAVNTVDAAGKGTSMLGLGLGDGLGAGVGDPTIAGGVTGRNAGALDAEPVLIYNAKPWPRSETVYANVWNKEVADDKVVVRDSSGKEAKGQVIKRGDYWGHKFATVAFRAEDVPAVGYKVYAIDNTVKPLTAEGVKMDDKGFSIYGISIPGFGDCRAMENEYLKVSIDTASGAVKSIVDKKTGFDYVPEGKLLGLLEMYQETPHDMTAWLIGGTPTCHRFDSAGVLNITQSGPNRAVATTVHRFGGSKITVEVGLNAGSRTIDFKLNAYWVERGTPETGVPMLKVAFPVSVTGGMATYEIPFGAQKREQSSQEIPALKWADISGDSTGGKQGLTLVNDSKYGHSCNDGVLRLTLIRSSYDPDPIPEVAEHEIKFAVIPHEGECDVVAATRAGEEFNSPMAVVSTTVQKGKLPAEKSFVECLTPNVFVSAVKKSEDGKAIVVRVFETLGKSTTAELRIADLVKSGSKAVECDILERPLPKSSAQMTDDVVTVKVPAFGQATVRVGK